MGNRKDAGIVYAVGMRGAAMGFVWLAAAVCVGQNGPIANQAGSVSGQVINASTSEGLRKATVTVEAVASGPRPGLPGARFVTTTDAGGAFTVNDVPPGRYSISAERTGFVRWWSEQRPGSRATVTVAPGQDLAGVTLKLIPQGVITGRVMDEEGDPVQGAMVQVLKVRYAQGRKQLLPMGPAGNSNDIGEFRIAGVPPGRVLLSVLVGVPSMNRVTTRRMPDRGFAPLYFPGVTDPSQAAPISIAAGAEFNTGELRLQRSLLHRVSGKVNGITGRFGISVMLYPRNSMMALGSAQFRPTPVQPDGTFWIAGVQAGEYFLQARQASGRNDHRSGRAAVTVGAGDVENVEITLSEGLTVNGTVRVEAPGSVQLDRLIVQPQPTEGSTTSGFTAQVESNGTFATTVPDPAPVRFSLLNIPDGYYLKAMRYGGQDVAGNMVDFSSGGVSGPVEFLLAPNAPVLDGIVQNEQGDPVGRATVTLVPEGALKEQWDLYKVAQSDQNGLYRFGSLPPGSYKLYAWQQIEEGAQQDPEFLRAYEGRAASVVLEQNGSARVPLKVIAPAQ